MQMPHTPNFAGATHIGRCREENQDHFLIADLRRQLTVIDTDVEDEHHDLYGVDHGKLLLVADGMGGHRDGGQASTTAVKACSRYVLDMMHWFLKLSPEHEQDFVEELKHCFDSAQQAIWGGPSPDAQASGTTVTLAYLLGTKMYVVHAGDSRCYLHRNQHLQQLTADHTFAQKMLDEKVLSPAEAKQSNWRHVLWNCVGGSERTVMAEVSRVTVLPGDQVLLCTDGLTGMLDDVLIHKILQRESNLHHTAQQLIDAANEAGGKDNVTVVLAQL